MQTITHAHTFKNVFNYLKKKGY